MLHTPAVASTHKTNVFKEGLRDSVAFGLPFLLLYLSLGMLGAGRSLSLAGVLATTVLIFSTPLQFLLVQHADSGWVLAPVILMMNARFALMAAAISPHIKDTRISRIAASSILIVPSVFTACMARFKHDRRHGFQYFLGIGIPLYGASIVCTYIGSAAGKIQMPPVLLAATTMVFPLQVTALSARHWPHYFDVASYWLGFVLAPFFIYVFAKYNLLLTPLLVGVTVTLAENSMRHRNKGENKK